MTLVMNLLSCLFLLAAALTTRLVSSADGSVISSCAHVIDATATETSTNVYTFSATVQSNETGWDKYADEWQVQSSDGEILLGTRTLLHPHVNEQPFTRSLANIAVPPNITMVVIRAQDSVLGYCGEAFELTLPGREGGDDGRMEEPTSTPTNGPSSGAVPFLQSPTSTPTSEPSSGAVPLLQSPTRHWFLRTLDTIAISMILLLLFTSPP